MLDVSGRHVSHTAARQLVRHSTDAAELFAAGRLNGRYKLTAFSHRQLSSSFLRLASFHVHTFKQQKTHFSFHLIATFSSDGYHSSNSSLTHFRASQPCLQTVRILTLNARITRFIIIIIIIQATMTRRTTTLRKLKATAAAATMRTSRTRMLKATQSKLPMARAYEANPPHSQRQRTTPVLGQLKIGILNTTTSTVRAATVARPAVNVHHGSCLPRSISRTSSVAARILGFARGLTWQRRKLEPGQESAKATRERSIFPETVNELAGVV